MASLEEQYAESFKKSQQAVIEAVESWTKSAQSAFTMPTQSTWASYDPTAAIDQAFDFAHKMLDAQRDFAKSMAHTAAAAVEDAQRQNTSGG